jgi:2-oxoglutarate dehydrogenase E1 component
MNDWGEFQGFNAAYVAELYERYERDPNSVDAATREFFAHGSPPDFDDARKLAELPAATAGFEKVVGAVNLAESIRKFGHLDAHLDPLGSPPIGDPSLRPETHGITEADLRAMPASTIVGEIALGKTSAWEVIEALRGVYCSTRGYDYAHLRSPEEREWLRQATESGWFRTPDDSIDEEALLERLTQVEVFEQFLHRTFPGKTRFSIEGVDMLVPLLDEIIGAAAEAKVRNVIIGMGHRARLNVLAHILNKPAAQILAEFKDPVRARNFREDLGWTGDVKYHLGARRAIKGGELVGLEINMPPNPSHLEAINPVVEGMARAAGTLVDRPGPPRFDFARTLAVLIHGDAGFAGEGIVAEGLNMYRLAGYQTGGTIHIITNNQIGYTTEPQEGRSTVYAGDSARGFRIPIVHVNADEPEAAIEAARLAFAYRAFFHKDFVIDLVGYRRWGHNEGDEPAFTQPLLYQKIAAHPGVRALWAAQLLARGTLERAKPEALVHESMEKLQRVLESLHAEKELVEPTPEPPPPGAARHARTAVSAERLRRLNEGLLALPEGFSIHKKLERARARRRHALDPLDEPTVEWAMAEDLALASILEDGIAVRLSGEDTERGTFSQRHAVFHDVTNGQRFIPLQALPQARAAFEVLNSPLSELAVLGFEYGYSMQEPGRLVIWEAQYGDFINEAQAIVDEFISSGRAKWGQTPSLVLLLPHGMEGQGPDHSSARLERFLQLAAETNLRIANPTTAAQYFHLLRLQAALLATDPLPLIVMTPKSLLRHPLVSSTLRELSEGSWNRVIADEPSGFDPERVRRVILSSGKVCLDLATSELRDKVEGVAMARMEQLYPFPAQDLLPVLERYPRLEEVAWVQEEPENMGAWEFVRTELARLVGGGVRIVTIGRPRNSSPAEGSLARHTLNQEAIVRRALSPKWTAVEENHVPLRRI